MEEQKDKKLAYPDVMIQQQENGSITTEWYNKEISSNRLLNYNSNHPKRMINAVAYSFTYRVLKITDRNRWYIQVYKRDNRNIKIQRLPKKTPS